MTRHRFDSGFHAYRSSMLAAKVMMQCGKFHGGVRREGQGTQSAQQPVLGTLGMLARGRATRLTKDSHKRMRKSGGLNRGGECSGRSGHSLGKVPCFVVEVCNDVPTVWGIASGMVAAISIISKLRLAVPNHKGSILFSVFAWTGRVYVLYCMSCLGEA